MQPTAYASFVSAAANPELAVAPVPGNPGGETGRLVNFANVIEVVVVGNPTEQALGELENHIRALYCRLSVAPILRDLRQLTEQHRIYPVMVFKDGSDNDLVTLQRGRTARPGERIDLHAEPAASPAGDGDENRRIIGLIASVGDALLQAQRTRRANAQLLDRLISSGQLRLASAEPTRHPVAVAGQETSSMPTPRDPGRSRSPVPLLETCSLFHPGNRSLDTEMPDIEVPDTALSALQARLDRQMQAMAHHSWQGTLMRWLGTEGNTAADEWFAIERAARNGRDREGIAAFKEFLVLLSVTDAHRHPAQRLEVADWLRRAALPGSAQLRADAFEACLEAAGSCQDGALSTWNTLSMLAIEADVREGRYRGRLADLHGVALSLFRMNELKTVASAKVAQLYAEEQRRAKEEQQLPEDEQLGPDEIIDPLETYLGYQIALREALHLPLRATRMHYPDITHITDEDIGQALQAVRRAEKERFPAWLLLDFEPFLDEVRHRLGPDASAKITNAAIEEYQASAKRRVTERLQALGLPDNDIERLKMSTQLSREIRYTAWLPHANQALAGADLPALPELDEDETRRTALLPDGALLV